MLKNSVRLLRLTSEEDLELQISAKPLKRCLLLVSIACFSLGAGSALAQANSTSKAQPVKSAAELKMVAASKPLGLLAACQKKNVGILGDYFTVEMKAFLEANGHAVTIETDASIAGGSLNNLNVLFLNRSGVDAAMSQAAIIEAWVRAGGVLITEFDATKLLFDGVTFKFFKPGTLDQDFAVPNGDVCGGNTVNVTSPANALATGLPASWPCSGDPIGVFKVYAEGSLDAAVDRVARVAADMNNDGVNDPVVGTASVDKGMVVPFFTDFADWSELENPRICPNGSCARTIEDETLLLNAVCSSSSNSEVKDHFLCYKVTKAKKQPPFKKREVIVRNQFGEQRYMVLAPDTICVPSTKEEVGK